MNKYAEIYVITFNKVAEGEPTDGWIDTAKNVGSAVGDTALTVGRDMTYGPFVDITQDAPATYNAIREGRLGDAIGHGILTASDVLGGALNVASVPAYASILGSPVGAAVSAVSGASKSALRGLAKMFLGKTIRSSTAPAASAAKTFMQQEATKILPSMKITRGEKITQLVDDAKDRVQNATGFKKWNNPLDRQTIAATEAANQPGRYIPKSFGDVLPAVGRLAKSEIFDKGIGTNLSKNYPAFLNKYRAMHWPGTVVSGAHQIAANQIMYGGLRALDRAGYNIAGTDNPSILNRRSTIGKDMDTVIHADSNLNSNELATDRYLVNAMGEASRQQEQEDMDAYTYNRK